jgi:hypothetical protein
VSYVTEPSNRCKNTVDQSVPKSSDVVNTYHGLYSSVINLYLKFGEAAQDHE